MRANLPVTLLMTQLEGLVRPLLVEEHEVVEARLLLQGIGRGGRGGFLLEREVHPLVTAVLFGVSGPDAFELDAEPQPHPRTVEDPVAVLREIPNSTHSRAIFRRRAGGRQT